MALITEQDDRTLVEQHRAGDHDAFRSIVLRHHRSLYANALRRLGDPVLAEDAVQEAFLRAFRNLDRFDGDYHLDAWLHRIVTNACHDIGRRRGRDTRLFDRACTAVEVSAPAADESLEATPRDQLTGALDALPETYREVLMLRFVDEMSYEDVALKAGITEENARARVSRGRAMLKRLLSSASALLVFVVPPLRRSNQLSGTEAEVANQAASQAQTLAGLTNVVSTTAAPAAHTAPGLGQLSSFVVQAAPAVAQAAPAVSSSGPALGKAAVAVGIAASVAVPAGVAVERAREKPPAPVAAPAADDSQQAAPDDPVEVASAPTPSTAPPTSAAPSTTAKNVEALSTGAIAPLTDGATTTTAPRTTTTETTVEESTPTTTAPAAGGSTPTTEPTDDGATEEPPPPPPSGDLTASSLTVTEAGPKLDLSGALSLVVGDQTFSGTLSGKVDVADADPKNAEAPREVDGWLSFELADGTVATLNLAGTAVVSEQGQQAAYQLALRFRLDNAAALGLAETGELTGRLDVHKEQGALTLTLPGAPADESADA